MTHRVLAVAGAALALAPSLVHAGEPLRDGVRFDPGAAMTEPAEGAPEGLASLAWMRGDHDVFCTYVVDDTTKYEAQGVASITFMNRGYSLMERFYCADFYGAGTEVSTLAFIVANPQRGLYSWSEANSYTQSIDVYSGAANALAGDDGKGPWKLVLRHAERHNGNDVLTYYRMTIERETASGFTTTLDESTDFGETWKRRVVKRYGPMTRVDATFLAPDGSYGSPAPDLPEEAHDFDFLVGEWDASNDMTFPNGQTARWKANATAVYMMNGHCVMEFNWFDTDPNLPDAATTIVRLWNGQMRRWENLYLTNRSNSPLYFGGVREGDRIVLHRFNADAEGATINRWIFHSMEKNTYGWYGYTSRDRGETWAKTWIIDFARKDGK